MPLIDLNLLEAHPDNANVMPAALLEKLIAHIRETGNYPPLIVRPLQDDPKAHPLPGVGRGAGRGVECAVGGRYQILDGHHRAIALRRLNFTRANCDIWDVDDAQANMLLLTLNRLHGEDDPRKRGDLLARLRQTMDLDSIASKLPDELSRIEKLIALTKPPPDDAIAAPKAIDEMPHAVTFFLTAPQRQALFAKLAEVNRDRSAAIVALLELDAGRR